MKKPFFQSMGSGLTLGAVVGVGVFLFSTPSDRPWQERLLSLLVAAVVALSVGVFLGLIFYMTERARAGKFDAFRAELSAGENLRHEESASLFLQGKNRSGRLFLTDASLIFRTYREGSLCCNIPLSSIQSVEVSDPRLCRITVSSEDGRWTFSVADPRFWFEILGKSSEDAS